MFITNTRLNQSNQRAVAVDDGDRKVHFCRAVHYDQYLTLFICVTIDFLFAPVLKFTCPSIHRVRVQETLALSP